MRILIDLQGCQSGSRFGGIGRYSMSLAKAMLRLQTMHEFYLLLNKRLPNENFIRAEFASLVPQQNILTFDVPPYVAAENDLPSHSRLAELIREKRIADINPDVLHIASLFEGAGEDVITSVGLLFPSERTAVTLYDLIPFLEQETYLSNPMLADHYLRKFDALARAGMIVSISEFSRAEALEHTSIPVERIVNISSAVDTHFSMLDISSEARNDLLKNYGIAKPFLMFTGSFDIRKNHERLVKAFAKLPSGLRQQYQLVIIGKGEDRQVAKLRMVGQEHGMSERDMVFVGHVTDEHLVALYNLCALFVFPSLREGFGLPVLEAMSCGAPTVGSNRTSVPEVIGRADALFDPEDVDDIAAKIAAALSDPVFREELKQHGLDRAKEFSWELSARKALEFFERQIDGSATERKSPAFGRQPESSPQETSKEWTGLDPGLRWDDGSHVEDSRTAAYDAFLATLSELKLGKLDDEFLESAARVIAANEFLTRIESESESFSADMRMGWVTNWLDGSAIAAYSQQFITALPKHPTVFAPYTTGIASVDGPKVISCWNASEGNDITDLQQALASSPIDVVVIQHAHGMLELSAVVKLVMQQKALNRAVFITLHSTTGLLALNAAAGMLEIRSALKTCDGIFVHSMSDVKNLETFKVRKNVNFIPNPALQNKFDKFVADGQRASIARYMLQKMSFAIASGG